MLPKNTDHSYVQQHVQQYPIKAVHKTIDEGKEPLTRKDFTKTQRDFKILVDLAYPPSNFECQKKGTKTNHNTQNKQMFGVDHSKEPEEIILAATKNIKLLRYKVLDNKTFMRKIPKEDVSNGSMREYK